MYGLLTAVVKEIKILRGMFGLGGTAPTSPSPSSIPNPPSANFEIKSKTTPEVEVLIPIQTHTDPPVVQKEIINLDFAAADKIVVSDDDEDDESSISEEDDSESESEYGSELESESESDSDSDVVPELEVVSMPITPESVPVQVFEIDVSALEQIPTLAPRSEISQFLNQNENENQIQNNEVQEVEFARTPERISGATSVGVQGLPKGEVTREDLSSKDKELEPTQVETIVFEDFAKQAKDVVENVVEEPDTHQNDTNLEPEPLPQVHPMEQLRKMNINQLKTIAIQLGITTDISKLKKPELISLIREKENANE